MSTNEELPPPPKPRASPLDFRNTDLVSRLLAATPPYLYNMPMVPNSYFFSEMLRSFVQAKAEANRGALPLHHRRSRKRPWMQQRDFYQKEAKPEVPSPNWNQKSPTPEKRTEIPLELTIDKPKEEYQQQQPKMPPPNVQPPPMMFPHPPQQETNQNLILPPPPPIWYPPLYPAPYGIDPLHFFIDLRVSGHIYDRKQKESTQPSSPTQSAPPAETASTEKSESYDFKEGFKQSRHASAFRVPIPNAKNSPMNLSNRSEENKVKFDVKSMGFERPYNRASTNYVMNNVGRIYRELNQNLSSGHNHKHGSQIQYKKEPEETEVKEGEAPQREETEEEREKRVKDLRALIGLELVVDYMNHAKPGQPISEDSTDNESSASPTLEVVALQEEV